MEEPFAKDTVLRRLEQLRRSDSRRRVFGTGEHEYELQPPLALSVIQTFEAEHGVTLPEDYRYFITEIGNGGAGPYYGLFPFGQQDDSVPWEEGDLIGDVSLPFPHAEAWNLPDSFFEQEPDVPPGTSREEEDKQWEAWDQVEQEHYWHPSIMNGAIPICHRGCALRQWLVINGDQKGFIWNDFRADHGGIVPLRNDAGDQVRFSEWYLSWLDESLQNARFTAACLEIARRKTRRRELIQALAMILAGVLLALLMALLRR